MSSRDVCLKARPDEAGGGGADILPLSAATRHCVRQGIGISQYRSMDALSGTAAVDHRQRRRQVTTIAHSGLRIQVHGCKNGASLGDRPPFVIVSARNGRLLQSLHSYLHGDDDSYFPIQCGKRTRPCETGSCSLAAPRENPRDKTVE